MDVAVFQCPNLSSGPLICWLSIKHLAETLSAFLSPVWHSALFLSQPEYLTICGRIKISRPSPSF
jgi:hypothetical protein